MNNRWLAICFLSVGALSVVTGCAGSGVGQPRWQIVAQANPNPMGPESKFFVEKPGMGTLSVAGKPDAEYSAGKTQEEQATWADNKTAFAQEFGNGFMAARGKVAVASAPGEGFSLRTQVTWIQPGSYSPPPRRGDPYAPSRPVEVRATIQVLDKAGAVQDEFTLYAKVDVTSALSVVQFRDAGNELGHLVADYVRKRTGND